MPKKIDLTGRRFGRLIVLHDTGERKNRCVAWHCKCDCGNEVDVRGDNLTSGNTTSCGCYNRERVVEANTTHGMSRQEKTYPVYVAWKSMLWRCENPNYKQYKDYGGRGVKVCEEWHDPVVFIDWALANGWREGLTLDRINNNGNYEPDNCRWATRKEQAQNRRSNHLVTFNGKTQCLTDWATELGINGRTLFYRIDRLHWPIERALTEPIRGHKHAS